MSTNPTVIEVTILELRRLAQEKAERETQEALIAAHEAGATQKELAEALRISRQAVAKRLTKCTVIEGCQAKGIRRVHRYWNDEGNPVTDTCCSHHVQPCWNVAMESMHQYKLWSRLQMMDLDGTVIEDATR